MVPVPRFPHDAVEMARPRAQCPPVHGVLLESTDGPETAPRPSCPPTHADHAEPSLCRRPRYPETVLYWATKPDPLFTKIVDVAISVGRDLVRTWEGSRSTEWATMYPGLAKFFTPATSNRELERLRVAHGAGKVFRPGDYQWLLLHEVLRAFCEAYNDQPMDAIEHEGTLIRHIDFEAILEI